MGNHLFTCIGRLKRSRFKVDGFYFEVKFIIFYRSAICLISYLVTQPTPLAFFIYVLKFGNTFVPNYIRLII